MCNPAGHGMWGARMTFVQFEAEYEDHSPCDCAVASEAPLLGLTMLAPIRQALPVVRTLPKARQARCLHMELGDLQDHKY